MASRTALGCLVRPEELTSPAPLASKAGRFVTGTVLMVDDGALATVF